ncbi:hypothetical protein [uncultured Bacteroides sp.]|uniref:hypothetical protein n=1 Tax=uncultured Bacteroides sp. TaxID=162156 RepID=UPI002595F907|nr:hypothetical protein [uncultured Bacteroides sp.]
MKKICLLLLASALFYACGEKTNEDKAKESIERYLKESMNDWDSYEFVDIRHLDSVFLVNDKKMSNIDFRFRYRQDSLVNAMDLEMAVDKNDQEEVAYYKNIIDSLVTNKYNKEFIGWETRFTFRGTNKFGAKVINTLKVQLDKDFFIDNVESVE